MHHTKSARLALGLPWSAAPYTSRFTCNGIRTGPDGLRQRHLLDIAWASRLLSNPTMAADLATADYYVDVSQSVEEKPWSIGAPTFTTSTRLFSFEYDSVIAAKFHLFALGVPEDVNLDSVSDGEQRLLAGEALPIPCATMLTWVYYQNPMAPWWKETLSDSDGVRDF